MTRDNHLGGWMDREIRPLSALGGGVDVESAGLALSDGSNLFY